MIEQLSASQPHQQMRLGHFAGSLRGAAWGRSQAGSAPDRCRRGAAWARRQRCAPSRAAGFDSVLGIRRRRSFCCRTLCEPFFPQIAQWRVAVIAATLGNFSSPPAYCQTCCPSCRVWFGRAQPAAPCLPAWMRPQRDHSGRCPRRHRRFPPPGWTPMCRLVQPSLGTPPPMWHRRDQRGRCCCRFPTPSWPPICQPMQPPPATAAKWTEFPNPPRPRPSPRCAAACPTAPGRLDS
jgi:hypothetical protein